jgi:hypothetical protein
MPISRRGFLGCAAGASAAGLAGEAGLRSLFAETSRFRPECVLVYPGSSDTLRESAAGYESALSGADVRFARVSFRSLTPARTMILPAAAGIGQSDLAQLRNYLERGSTVLFESGASFLNSGEFNFHRRLIRSMFGLGLHSPIRLWDSADSFKRSPYIDYRWPLTVKVRDFSRIVPVDDKDGETIAWFQELPVAVKRRVGKGTLVFLGSPLGPHLLTGDREAREWLSAFCSIS